MDKTNPSCYSTQANLLLCQIIYDAIKHNQPAFKTGAIVTTFRTHKLINDPQFRLSEHQLVQWLSNMLISNGLISEQDGSTKKVHLDDFTDDHLLIAKLANLYYQQRVEELETSISSNKTSFLSQLDQLKSLS